jgi:hypothetical protein
MVWFPAFKVETFNLFSRDCVRTGDANFADRRTLQQHDKVRRRCLSNIQNVALQFR